MKKFRQLFITSALASALLFTAPQPAHALSCYAVNVTAEATTPIMAAIVTLQQLVVQALAAQSAADTRQKNKSQNIAQANDEYTDRRGDALRGEDNAIKNTERVQDAWMDAADQYTPTIQDCAILTASVNREAQLVKDQQRVNTVVNEDATRQYEGPSQGAAQYQAEKVAARINGMREGNPEYSADMSFVTQKCGSSDCVNNSIMNNLDAAISESTGNRVPYAAKPTPEMRSYFVKYRRWQDDRSRAMETVRQTQPMMLYSAENYQLALKAYEGNSQLLLAKYPRADVIGMSHMQLLEAQRDGITNSGNKITQLRNNQKQLNRMLADRNLLDAQIKETRELQDRYNDALVALAVPPPNPPASGTAVTTQ